MGDAKRRAKAFKDANHPCIFCGGIRLATTQEHCPPRAMFREKHAPEGYVFPACEPCNHGTSDQDVMVSFMAHLTAGRAQEGRGLMYQVKRQFPAALPQMFDMGAIEARAAARRLNMRPQPGQTYQDLGLAHVPDDMRPSVRTFACKLTKAAIWLHSHKIFPNEGSIGFLWFTNAQRLEHGEIPALEAFRRITAFGPELRRNGKDLLDQFDYRYAESDDGSYYALTAVIGEVFGFATLASPKAGLLERIDQELKEKTGKDRSPFEFVTGPTA